MRKIIFIVFGAILFFACKKSEPQPYNVSYKIEETTTATPAYTVTYSTENATQTEGPITFANWSSPTVKKMPGELVSLSLEGEAVQEVLSCVYMGMAFCLPKDPWITLTLQKRSALPCSNYFFFSAILVESISSSF